MAIVSKIIIILLRDCRLTLLVQVILTTVTGGHFGRKDALVFSLPVMLLTATVQSMVDSCVLLLLKVGFRSLLDLFRKYHRCVFDDRKDEKESYGYNLIEKMVLFER